MRIVLNASLGKAQILERLATQSAVDVAWVDNGGAAAQALPGAQALICPDHFYSPALAEAVKSKGGDLRWIQLLTAGYDHIKRLGARPGVSVSNAGAAFAPSVAAHAVTLLLSLQRNIPACIANKPQHAWERGFTTKITTPSASTVAVVGFGPIGREIAQLLRAFGAKVIAVTRSGKADAMADESARVGDLRAVLARVDAVVLALPLDETSRHLIGAAEFAAMKPTAFLVNIARGAIIDQTAFAAALAEGKLAGAGIDVTDPEPLPSGHPLWDAPNLIISPHCAGACGPIAGERMADVVIGNLERFIAGKPLENIVAL